MGIIEEILKMKSTGASEPEIIHTLQEEGLNETEIATSLAQARIKEAVSGRQTEDIKEGQNNNIRGSKTTSKKEENMDEETPVNQYENMQPSMLTETSDMAPQAPQESYPMQDEQPQYDPSQQPQDAAQYQQYQPYQSSNVSADTITEISEQIVSEKMASMKKQVEKIIDFKNSLDSKLEFIDERLRKVEKIIDRLQLSVLQKVGDYMTNVEDIKRELVETQKSFKSISGKNNTTNKQSNQLSNKNQQSEY